MGLSTWAANHFVGQHFATIRSRRFLSRRARSGGDANCDVAQTRPLMILDAPAIILFSTVPLENPAAMRHVLSAIVQNVPGVLAHISGMLASRGYNIDSLAVGETEDPNLSRMTFVMVGDDRVLEQVRKQLEKIVTVVRVDDISSQDNVERDLMLIKVKAASGGKRSEVRELVEIFRGRIVDVGEDEVMVEISGRENKVQAFIERMRSFGITELVRSGRIAMVRSAAARKEENDGP